MTQYLSDKIKIMSFFAIVVVLYIHAGLPKMAQPDGMMQVALVAREIVARIIGDCAVPMFYCISGYLFFRHAGCITDILLKMRKRVKSLLIPFVIASIHVPLFYILIELIPGVSSHINADPFFPMMAKMPLGEILCSLFYDSGNTFPWAVHLWFLRDLIIIVACAPTLFWGVKRIGKAILAIVLVLYALFPELYFLYGMIWFLAGHFFLDRLSSSKPTWRIPILWLAITICHSFTPAFEYWRLLKVVEISLGVITFWNLYDAVVPSSFRLEGCKWLKTACGFTFFVYLYHDPEYHTIVKGIPMMAGQSGGDFLAFVLSPLIHIPLMIIVGTLLKRYIPKVYSILVGGR